MKVMELCDGGSLYDLKEVKKSDFSEEELSAIMAFRWQSLLQLHTYIHTLYYACLTLHVNAIINLSPFHISVLGLAHLHSHMSIHRVGKH